MKFKTRHFFCLLWLFATLFVSAHAQAAPAAPANLQGQLDGTTVLLSWPASTEAEGYNVYKNNSYLTTTYNLSYSTEVEADSVNTFYVIAFSRNPSSFSPRSKQVMLPEKAVPTDLTIPPSVPTGLVGEVNGTTLTLNWTPSTDDEAVSGYNVYRNNLYLTTVFKTQYTATVDPDKSERYAIVAFDIRSNFSAKSDPITLPETGPVDTTIAPTPPTELSGDITDNSVTLNWTAATDDQGVAGYNVYVNNAYKSTVFTTRYVGKVEADKTYSYYLVAFDHDGNFSKRSASINLPDGEVIVDTEAPQAVSTLSGTWQDNGETADLTLEWEAPTDNVGVSGYNIYENKRYLTTVYTTHYAKTVSTDGIYTYSVVAFDVASNFSAASNRLTLPETENQAPIFLGLSNQTGYAGSLIEILIKPVDYDSNTPGLYIGTLPVGMRSVDNLNGSRTLTWDPLQPDVGTYDIQLTAFDASDTDLRTQVTLTLTIEMPDDPSTIRNVKPGIDLVQDHVVRIGDTVIMEVKATDRNGTIPTLNMNNLPEGASFEVHPEIPNIRVLRWTTTEADAGVHTFSFTAIDAIDDTLTVDSNTQLMVLDSANFQRTGSRLRDLSAAHNKLIGFASLLKYYNKPDADLYQSMAAEEFNLVTTENSLKWGYFNPEPGKFRYDDADTLMQYANDNDMLVHGHTMVWYTSLPQWVQTSALDEREGLMYDYIDALTTRYPSIAIWDVVNEAFEEDGRYRNSIWYQAMGEDYIEKAFRRARAGDPDAVLLYNDYNIAYKDEKTDAVYDMAVKLLANGAPLDGIGFQMHVGANFTNFDKVAAAFDRFASLGLDIYITEFDVTMTDEQTLEDQANVFEQIVKLCLERDACKAIQVWGVTDRYSWLKDKTPLLFDINYQPKPAYYGVQNALAPSEED